MGNEEIKLVNKVSPNLKNKLKYFVFLDKYDCFNCTLSASLIGKYIDSSQVFVLSNQIPKSQIKDFAITYGLNMSFRFIESEELLNYFKKNVTFKDKSFIVEVNSPLLSIIPLKRFINLKSFGLNIDTANERKIFNKGYFISSIPKFVPLKNDFIAFTSPKNSIYYFYKDSLKKEILLDSNILKKSFKYIIAELPDSIEGLNSFSKCLETYNTQLKKLSLSLISPQNILVSDSICYIVAQISFPIWTSHTNVTFTGKIFFLMVSLKKHKFWQVEKIIPIDNSSLPKSKTIFGYNFFSYNVKDSTLDLGFYLDSNIVKDKSSNNSFCSFTIKNGIFSLSNKCLNQPNEVIKEYSKSQNLSLIFYKLDLNKYHYTYLPLITSNKAYFTLPMFNSEYYLYHCYASKIILNGLIDLCSINGLYYLIKYKCIEDNYMVESVSKVEISGLLQSAFSNQDNFEYIRYWNGFFYRNVIKF